MPINDPIKFNIISSTSKNPILKNNCISSIESITGKQMTKVLNTFLLLLFETKNPKGIKTRMFAIMFLKA